MHYRAVPAWRQPVALAVPRPGDFTCVPIAGPVGLGVEVGLFLDGDKFQPYEHTEVYVGKADAAGPYGYTVSTYPDGRGKRPLPCKPQDLPGSLWSSGIIELTGAQRTGIVAWAMAHQDVTYSFADYGALVLHRLGVDARWLREYIKSTRSMICSWWTDAAFLYGGAVHLFDDKRWEGYVTPGDLAGLLQGMIVTV